MRPPLGPRVVDFSSSMYSLAGSSSMSEGGKLRDAEAADMLAPGMSKGENILRWGFIRKVYGIVSAQLILTTVVSATMMANKPLANWVKSVPALHFVIMIASFGCLFALYAYKDKHPTNLAILGVWTFLLSITVGTACSMYAPAIVLEALLLTSGVVMGLTMYTFWAVRRGQDFSHWGSYLFTAVWGFFLWGLVQMLFPHSEAGRTVYALLGTLLFSLYLVYDTNMLITKHSVDEYIWASVELYLDMINLFLYILEILNRSQRN
mmetsp:Transcript_32260/g.91477  ORF Transcript_32260/g.91477 Transcript_32260/m.91477 type:complete len:264 (-) Transcript_32260:321-1112(-)